MRDAERVLSALTRLMADWTATSTQARIADEADAAVDPIDIPPVYELGGAGPMRASALAALLHVTRPTMSKQLARLERAGLIERQGDPSDGRASVVALSPRGEEIYRRLLFRGREMVAEAMAPWGAGDTARFGALLEEFVARVGVPAEEETSAGGAERGRGEPAAERGRGGPAAEQGRGEPAAE